MTYDDDTITAISTPPGAGGIGIVRISGSRALDIAHRLFVSSRQHDIRSVSTYSLHHGCILHPETRAVLDETLVSVMRAPHSYTREDVVEINCHGGMLPLQNVLAAVLTCGARLAIPGEFTKRAFLNGRIDLSQAESVIDIIRAKTDASLQLAIQQLRGKLSQRVSPLRDALSHLLASIEASLDFAEDEIEIISYEQIHAELCQYLAQLDQLLTGAYEGKIVRDGLTIVIVGKPNVGKSSLLNLFLEEERAIVTSVPGTTRDTIEDYINLHGIPIRLIDTAGIRDTNDHIEQLGVDRSRQMIQQADMVLCMFDSSVPWSQDDDELVQSAKEKKKIVIANKMDLPTVCSPDDMLVKFSETIPAFQLSINQHRGIDALKQAIVADVMNVPFESVIVTNSRHKQALYLAKKNLVRAQKSTETRMSQEFMALDLREALNHLGEITGETTSEDILDVIFSTFCVGK